MTTPRRPRYLEQMMSLMFMPLFGKDIFFRVTGTGAGEA